MEMMAVGPRLIGRRVAQIFRKDEKLLQQVLHGWGGKKEGNGKKRGRLEGVENTVNRRTGKEENNRNRTGVQVHIALLRATHCLSF